MYHKQWFTLVELIVVITIVGILSTIGFVAYSGYLGWARDGNRIASLTKLSDSLQTYAASKSLPLPDDAINIDASGTTIAYQGYVGENVLETIDFTNGGKDPKDDAYYTYYLSQDRRKLQLLTFLEEQAFYRSRGIVERTFAADYSGRYPKTYGQKLGVLISSESATKNTPAQEISANINAGKLDISTGSTLYTEILDDSETFTASGYTLWGLMAARLWDKSPTECPIGFIGVPGNPEFNTKGFCVAQYEMTYSDANTPNSTLSTTLLNTVSYVPWKTIVSQAGKYPIADITQPQAIAACQSMGVGYHLITNNEWMTIARNIESNAKNWSTGTVGVWNLWNGVSNKTTYGCNATGGNSNPRSFATKTGAWESSCNPRRSHTLSNGQTIWDMSGNVWEHVNKEDTIDGNGYNVGQTAVSGSSAPTAWDNDGIYNVMDMKRYGSATFFGIWAGMWNLHYAQGVASNIIIRGGSASDGETAGVFTLSLGYTSGNAYGSLGFRCAK